MSDERSKARGLRADSLRNREAITVAALAALAADPRASMAEIAQRAGVSRVTLYGHVNTRAELLALVLEEHVGRAVNALADCTYERGGAAMVDDLVRCSWGVMAELGPLMVEAEAELGARVVRQAHAGVLQRVDQLIAHGVAQGDLATTQPSQWLSYAYFSLLTGATQLSHGRANQADVVEELIESVGALLQVRT